MASVPTKPESKAAETSSQEPDKTIPLEDPEKENSPTSSSSSSSEVKTDESGSDPLSDTSPGDVSSTPSAAVTTDQEQAQLTVIPVLKELVKIVPNQETLPIFTPSASYGGVDDDQTIHAASANSEGKPLIRNEEMAGDHQFLGSDSPTNLEFHTPQNSDDHSSSVQQLNCMQRYVVYSVYLANSFFMMPFLLALLGMCIFALYMGGMYYDQCELMKNVPLFLVFMGVIGAFGVWTRMISILSGKGWFEGQGNCKYATNTTLVALAIFYLIEISEYVYYMNDYTAEQGPSYCDPYFYSYVWWNNWAMFFIMVILIVIHLPNSTSMARILITS